MFGTDTATVSKLGQFRSPYIACPFQHALASVLRIHRCTLWPTQTAKIRHNGLNCHINCQVHASAQWTS